MHLIYRKEELAKVAAQMAMPEPEANRPLWQNGLFFASLVGILVFANWGKPSEPSGVWNLIFSAKWIIASVFAVGLAAILVAWFRMKWWKVVVAALPAAILAVLFPRVPMIPFAAAAIGLSAITSTDRGESGDWFASTWGFAKQIFPLLFAGVLVAGMLLGAQSGHEGLIPRRFVETLVGDKPDTFLAMSGLAGGSWESPIRTIWPVWTNFFASIFAAFMYFATLTEVPIVQGLMNSGMGKGPALSLLLAGPALSLPSMIVISSIMGFRKMVVYVSLVVVMSTITGVFFGAFWG